jgi:hypothetical protein
LRWLPFQITRLWAWAIRCETLTSFKTFTIWRIIKYQIVFLIKIAGLVVPNSKRCQNGNSFIILKSKIILIFLGSSQISNCQWQWWVIV